LAGAAAFTAFAALAGAAAAFLAAGLAAGLAAALGAAWGAVFLVAMGGISKVKERPARTGRDSRFSLKACDDRPKTQVHAFIRACEID
jgi:hypothetical protein